MTIILLKRGLQCCRGGCRPWCGKEVTDLWDVATKSKRKRGEEGSSAEKKVGDYRI
jgi:hypothetical protein